jgi:integrase
MPRTRTGSIEPHRDHFDARVRLPDGRIGPRICLDPSLAREQAKAEAAELQRISDTDLAPRRRKSKGGAEPKAKGETLDRWIERWFTDREGRGFEDVETDRSRYRTWIADELGSKLIASITTEELESFVEALDGAVRGEQTSWKTAVNAWSLVLSIFDDASRSKTRALRVRTDNPAKGVRGPDRGVQKAKVYLWPTEVSQLLRCTEVPQEFRRSVAVAIYMYLRAAEQRAFAPANVDLDHGVALVHESEDREGKKKSTKGKRARRVPIEPPLLPLLRAMCDDAKREGSRVLCDPGDPRHLSRNLRRWLLRAGVTREDLHVPSKDKTRKPMTWHDLRATGVTWCAVRGDAPQLIMQRAGHQDFETTMGYIREAENLAAGFGEVFPPLPLAALGVPEAAAVPLHAPSAADARTARAAAGNGRSGAKVAPATNLPGSSRESPKAQLTSGNNNRKSVEAPGIEPGSARHPAHPHSRA